MNINHIRSVIVKKIKKRYPELDPLQQISMMTKEVKRIVNRNVK